MYLMHIPFMHIYINGMSHFYTLTFSLLTPLLPGGQYYWDRGPAGNQPQPTLNHMPTLIQKSLFYLGCVCLFQR